MWATVKRNITYASIPGNLLYLFQMIKQKQRQLDRESLITMITFKVALYSENIRCVMEACKQTYSWGASAQLPQTNESNNALVN